MNMDTEAHYYFTIAAFAELAEKEGLDIVLSDLCKVLDIDKAQPYNLKDLKRVYDALQYMQDSTVNTMLMCVQNVYGIADFEEDE